MKIYQALLFYVWFTLIIAIPPFALSYYWQSNLIMPDFWLIFAFLSGMSLLVVAAMLIVSQMYPTVFTGAFLGGTVFKILACAIFLLVFLSKNKVEKPIFVADFFYVYFLNTAFEVYILLRTLRHKISR
jgi:hypothetical protein